MSTELAVGLAAAAVVLMVGILLGIAAIVALDVAVAWPRPAHRRPKGYSSPGEQFFAWSEQGSTVPLVIDGRPVR